MIILTAASPAKIALKKMNYATTAVFARIVVLTKAEARAVTTAYAWKALTGTLRATAAAAAANALKKTNSAPNADTAWIAV